MSPLAIATRGYLFSTLSIATDGYLGAAGFGPGGGKRRRRGFLVNVGGMKG